MTFSIKDSVALVTAGTSGLGFAVAERLAQAGARVVVNYASNDTAAEAAVQQLVTKYPGSNDTGAAQIPRYMAIKADMSRRENIDLLVSKAVESMGGLDIVVSNAGWTKYADFGDFDQNVDESVWDRCFAINVKAHLFLFHSTREYLQKVRGTFIMTCSVAGIKPSGSSISEQAYSVTKAAQLHLAKAMAVVGAPLVRVNCVSPGFMDTNWISTFPESKINEARQKTLLKKLTDVGDVADQVLLLVKSESATGANFVLDSGFSV